MIVDSRIEKTYLKLQTSMRSQLGQVDWEQISVQSLCDAASVSRTTFYSHFSNKEDLLDTLLVQFENAMKADNNGRSLNTTGTLKFLPILVSHVSENRKLFAKNNMQMEGYPIAVRFKELISRLVWWEFEKAFGSNCVNAGTVHYVSGGIYSSLVHWSANSKESLHLNLLERLDHINSQCIDFQVNGKKSFRKKDVLY